MEIQLTRGKVCTVDFIDADLDSLKWHSNPYGHARRSVYLGGGRGNTKSKAEFMHRVILERKLKRKLKEGEQTEHKDGNPLNNRRSNLRVSTQAENTRNRGAYKNNTSGFKGVTKVPSGRWQAQIQHDKKHIVIGLFDSPIHAAKAYNVQAKKLHKQFARLNVLD